MEPVRAVALPPEAPAAARGSEGVLTAGALAGFGYGLLWLLVVGQASLGSLLVYFLALVLLAASVGVSAGVVSLAVAQGSAGRPSLTGPARMILVVVAMIGAVWWYWTTAASVNSQSPTAAAVALIPVAGVGFAVVAAGVARSRTGPLTLAIVATTAATFLWAAATHLPVSVTQPLPIRAGQASVQVVVYARGPADYAVRLGGVGCWGGDVVVRGHSVRDDGSWSIEIPRVALPAARNELRVCLNDGLRAGDAEATIEVDELAPAIPSIRAEPVTGSGGIVTSDSRHIQFSGTAEPGASVEVRLDGEELYTFERTRGEWTYQWWAASTRTTVDAQAIVRDRAGNETRSEPLAIRFVGTDPPEVVAPGHPRISIDCRGRLAVLPAADCAALGGARLARSAQLEPSTVRVVLTDDAEGCAAVLLGPRDRLVTYDRFDCPFGS